MSDRQETRSPVSMIRQEDKPTWRAVRWPIHYRLTLFVGFIVVFTAEVLSITGYLFTRNLMLTHIHDELSVVASDRQRLLLDYIRHQQERVRLVTSRTRLRQLLEEREAGTVNEADFRDETTHILLDACQGAAGCEEVFIADAKGTVIAATEDKAFERSFADNPDYLFGKQRFHLGVPSFTNGMWQAYLAAPLKASNGKFSGVLMMLVDVSSMAGFLSNATGLGQTGEVVVGTRSGNHIHYLFPTRRGWVTQEISLAKAPAMAAAMRHKQGFVFTIDYKGSEVIAAYRAVGYKDWGLVAKIDVAEAYGPIRVLRHQLFGLGFLILIVGVLVTFVAARRFTRPILELAGAAEAVRAGDLKARVVIRAPNEIGMLGEAFNRMTEQLGESYETLERRVEDRTHELALSERALRHQTSILQSMLDNLGDGVVVADENGKFLLFNRAAERIIGIGMTDAPPAEWSQEYGVFLPDGVTLLPSDQLPLVRAIHGEKTDHVELFIRNERIPKGVHISVTGRPLTDEAGVLKGGVVVIHDITQHKLAEKTLRDSEALYHSLVESLPLNVFRKDVDGRFTFGNQRFIRTIGRTLDELRSLSDYDFYPKELADKYRRDDQRVIETGEVFEDIEEHLDPGGELTYVHVLKSRVYDARRGVIGVQGMFWDITAQKRAEDALACERDLLHTLMDNIPDMIYFKDTDSRFTLINQAVARALGVTNPQDAVGKSDFDYFSPEQAREFFNDDRNLLQTAQPIIGKVEKFPSAEGDVRWVSTTKVPLRDKNGHVTGLFGISRDVTELEQAHMALEKSAVELMRSNAELEQFAYVASHDLQEPLRMVISYLQLLERRYRDKIDDDGKEFIDYAVGGANRMRTLIDDLLAFSRVGTRSQPFESADCQKLFARVMTNLLVSLGESGARVTHDPLPKIFADPVQIEQLLQNLISNAIKFHKKAEPPSVHVAATRTGNQWVFSVRDNGIGIDAEHRERIFAIFQRLHSWSEYPGTGIGLAICKRIVERHGGRIWVESQPGRGSTFFFTIPVREETPA